jgi:hypothetical protein
MRLAPVFAKYSNGVNKLIGELFASEEFPRPTPRMLPTHAAGFEISSPVQRLPARLEPGRLGIPLYDQRD